nr:histidine kinase [Bacteroidota bacterium]
MLNPILSDRKNFLVYLFSGIFVSVLHFVILSFFFGLPPMVSAADALVYTTLLFLLGIGIWYMVSYLSISDQSYHLVLADHLVTGGIIILLWLFGGFFILDGLFAGDINYQEFLGISLPWRFVYGILLYAVLVMIYYLMNYYRVYQEKLMQEAELKQIIKESELNLLKSQINPHFLFNSLNSINSLIIADAEKAREMIIELSDFLRYTVRTNEKETVTLKEELDNIQCYLNIEKIRFGDRILVEDEIEDACLERKIPNMILQPFFENAVKHGVNESTDAVTITTMCTTTDEDLTISISNNFTAGSISKKGKGIGIENIKKRMMLHYKRNDLVNIRKKSNIFEVVLTFPNQENIEKN